MVRNGSEVAPLLVRHIRSGALDVRDALCKLIELAETSRYARAPLARQLAWLSMHLVLSAAPEQPHGLSRKQRTRMQHSVGFEQPHSRCSIADATMTCHMEWSWQVRPDILAACKNAMHTDEQQYARVIKSMPPLPFSS